MSTVSAPPASVHRIKYVVLFRDPAIDGGWGYSGLTVFESRHEAVGKLAILRRINPDVDYRMTVFGA